jgi:two-component system sensor histidine kinase and response regulator WspE
MSDDLSGFSLIDLFRSEADGQLAALSEGLMAVERGESTPGLLESLMRAAHSLKGAARIVGLDAAVVVAHAMEDSFVLAQRGELPLGSPHVDVLLQAVDLLAAIAQLSEADAPAWQLDHQPQIEATVARLQALPTLAEPEPVEIPTETIPEVILPPEPELKSEPVIEAVAVSQAPAAANEPPSRVIRVAAESLSRLMGLAGESLVQARRLRPFVDGLMTVRSRQAALIEALQALGDGSRENAASPTVSTSAAFGESLLMARADALRCLEALTSEIEAFEEYARHGEDLASRLHHEVLASRMRPMAEGARGFPRMVREVARELGKQVRFEVRGETTGVDRDILEKLEAPLNHLVRNALDHALEPPDERKALGKDPTGVIRLEARHSAGMLQITLADDGRGVDVERIRVKVVARGLASEEMARRMTEAELLEFLFLPGFSTKEAVTEISGRGVGLDVVQEMARSVGGMVRVTSRPGKGTRFTLQLPITMSVARALIVKIAGEPYAFPLNRIDRIARVARDEVRRLEGRPHFLLDGQLVGLIDAVTVFDLGDPSAVGDPLAVVVVSDRSHRFGLVVDDFLGERDLEVRPLDPRLGKPPDVNSASVLEDGWPVLIVDVEDLVRSIDNRLGGRRLKSLAQAVEARVRRASKRILVVDDSITVRELERQLLEGRGYAVDVAVDGVDGWNAIRSGDYHLVISDVDMPRMDGIELVRSIKGDARLKSTPVVIVSYKDREEDRMRGLDAGADGYLTKSSFHDRTFLDAVADLIGEANAP